MNSGLLALLILSVGSALVIASAESKLINKSYTFFVVLVGSFFWLLGAAYAVLYLIAI